jgi:hypothetical protein
MKQDITLAKVNELKQELDDKIQKMGINELVQEFYDKTGIGMRNIHINWTDMSSYREFGTKNLGLLAVEYERVGI